MTMKQTKDELEHHLKEHIEFIESSADAFDNGFKGESKRLAVSLRVLLHDTRSSTSLLKQLDKKNHSFINTALAFDEDNVASHCGLVNISATNQGAEFIAPLDGAIVGTKNWTPFEDWWNQAVFVDKDRRKITRNEITTRLANKDGGAHVDPNLDEKYAALSRKNSIGWVMTDGTNERPLEGPEKAAVRQIAHEVLKTLIPGYKKKISESPPGGIVFGGGEVYPNMSIKEVKNKSNSKNFEKIGRNDKCPCGSGMKYKKCHGKPS